MEEETVIHGESEEQAAIQQPANPGHRTHRCAFHKAGDMVWIPVRDGEGQGF